MQNGHTIKLIIVVLLIAAGIVLEVAGLLDTEEILAIARQYSYQWRLVLALFLLQTLLFTFTLTGSLYLTITNNRYTK